MEQTIGDKLTRRDCTLLGAKWSAICTAATIGVILVPGIGVRLLDKPALTGDLLVGLIRIQFACVPPAAAIGALMGFELYRLTSGCKELRKTSPVLWVIAFFVVGWIILFLWLHRRHREKMLEGAAPAWGLPIFYGVVILLLALIPFSFRGEMTFIIYALGICGAFISLFVTDSLLVNQFGRLRDNDRLAEPLVRNIQFSLATMLLCTLGLGAYVTGLIKIFGK